MQTPTYAALRVEHLCIELQEVTMCVFVKYWWEMAPTSIWYVEVTAICGSSVSFSYNSGLILTSSSNHTVSLSFHYFLRWKRDENGRTPLHWTAINDAAEAAGFLLSFYKNFEQDKNVDQVNDETNRIPDISLMNNSGMTALHLAAKCGGAKVITAICDSCNNAKLEGKYSSTPSHPGGCISEILMNLFTKCSEENKTPYDYAMELDLNNSFELARNKRRKVEAALKEGGDPHFQKGSGLCSQCNISWLIL